MTINKKIVCGILVGIIFLYVILPALLSYYWYNRNHVISWEDVVDIMAYITFMFVTFFPLFLGSVYFIYLFCLFRGIFHKNKNLQPVQKEKKKALFYNLWLPCMLYTFLVLMFSLFVKNGFELSPMTGVFFWFYYLIYHSFYAFFTWLISCKYYAGKIFWVIFLSFFIEGLLAIVPVFYILAIASI